MAGIEVRDLRKVYGSTVALDGVSFAVEPGEVVGFLGPNGAGKSTTMRILTGFLSPTGGSATVDGFDTVEDSIEVRRRIGYLPEHAPVYKEMRVDEYLAFVCSARSLPRSEHAARIRGTAERVGLTDVLSNSVCGEKSKVSSGRQAIASRPRPTNTTPRPRASRTKVASRFQAVGSGSVTAGDGSRTVGCDKQATWLASRFVIFGRCTARPSRSMA